jgi:LacI family transcriptional regulator
MGKVSLEDIAKKVGVSKTTASFVLNGMGKQKRISDDIIKKVLAAAEEMNYKPHRLARSLRTGSTNVLGVIVIDVANNFHSKLSRSIENRAAENGYRVMICSSDENDTRMAEWVDELIANNVEGIIITPTVQARSKLIELKKAEYPFVLVDRHFPDFKADFVGIDNFKASFDAINLLIEEGYRDIGIIAFEPLLSVAQQRIEGYKQAILQNGMQLNPELIRTISYKNTQNEVRNHVTELVHDGVRALLFTSNRIGITGLHRLNELKVRIPQDIAIFSYDDNDFYPLMTPSISVISQPIEEMGRQAVEMILDRIKQPDREPQYLIMSAEVIRRDSI